MNINNVKYNNFLSTVIDEINKIDLLDPNLILEDLLPKIQCCHIVIDYKIQVNQNLTISEKKLYYETTKPEEKINLNFYIFKDLIFQDIYKIYLTEINEEVKKMSKSYSNNIPIRELYRLKLNPKEIVDFLKKIVKDFNSEILKNDNLFQENNALKNAIKNEFKKTKKEIKKENEGDVENKIFNTILYSKMIYLNLMEQNLDNKTIMFNNQSFELNIAFFVHITFAHYYHVLKESDKYLEKDHFEKYEFNDWKEILSRLSIKFNEGKYNLENTNIINFIIDEKFYRLVLNKIKKVIISLFPLNSEEILKVDLKETIHL